MNKFFFMIFVLLALCGCIKVNKYQSSSSAKVNNTPSDWILMGGTYQGSGLALKGKVTTYAGSQTETGSIDGKLTAVRFGNPDRMTINKENIYITDGFISGIRKVDIVNGEVSTILKSNGIAGQYFGITTHGDFLYVFDTVNFAIMKIDINTEAISVLAGNGVRGQSDGYGFEAAFDGNGEFLTTDGKFLYLIDTGYKIRKINIVTGFVSTLTLGLQVPTGQYLGGLTTDGNYLYIISSFGILKVSISDGSYSIIHNGGDGQICFDGKYLYFLKEFRSIQRLSLKTNVVENLVGDENVNVNGYQDGDGVNALFSVIGSMVSDGKKLYVLDPVNHVLRTVE